MILILKRYKAIQETKVQAVCLGVYRLGNKVLKVHNIWTMVLRAIS